MTLYMQILHKLYSNSLKWYWYNNENDIISVSQLNITSTNVDFRALLWHSSEGNFKKKVMNNILDC